MAEVLHFLNQFALMISVTLVAAGSNEVGNKTMEYK
jgi:hypothetical protein